MGILRAFETRALGRLLHVMLALAFATNGAPASGQCEQWLAGGRHGGTAGGTVSGADAPTLRIDGIRPSDAGVYECAVSNSCGTATSEGATLDVRCPADF